MSKARHRKPSNTKKNMQRAATVATGGVAVVAISATATPAMATPVVVTEEIPTIVPVQAAPVLETPVVTAPVVSTITGDMVVNEARKHMGANYVWGGESDAEGGFDCSGLVFRVYADLGIDVPRTSGALASVGTAVSMDQAQPGDILHWPGHVAIYVGGGMMVESAKPGTTVHERNVYGSPSVRRILTGAETAPAPTPAPAPVEAAPVAETVTVQPGDYLSKIAPLYGTDWQTLYSNNRDVIGANPNLIFPGQVYFVGGLPLPKAPVTVEEEVIEEPAGEETVETVPVPAVEALAIITNSAGPVAPQVQAAANAVFTNVRGASLITVGGTRSSARDPHGHPSGKALDYMVMSDTPLGDAIVQYHIDNWDSLGVDYIIWQQRIMTQPGGGWDLMEDRGSPTQNHMDHPHVNYR